MDEIESQENIARIDNIFDIIYAKAIFDLHQKNEQLEYRNEINTEDYFYQIESDKVYSDFVVLVNNSNIPDQARVYYQVTFLQSSDWKNTIFKSQNRVHRIACNDKYGINF